MSVEKVCVQCESQHSFNEGEPTGFIAGRCVSCHSSNTVYSLDNNFNLYFIDDEGFKNPAPNFSWEDIMNNDSAYDSDNDDIDLPF